VDYQANKEYILEFLCINRDKPELKCEGKCELVKKLKKDNAEKQSRENKLTDIQLNLFMPQHFRLQPVFRKFAENRYPPFNASHTVQVFHAIYHPPQSIV